LAKGGVSGASPTVFPLSWRRIGQVASQGRADVAAGRTVPLDEAFDRFRQKHGLPH
jgi:hypothetical protein